MSRAAFRGVIDLDIRHSQPDWDAYLPRTAPPGAPNVLVILYDDTGMAAWSPYGGRIQMPTLQRLADGGLTYSQWHAAPLCAPTRSSFLTGRNPHQNGFGQIAEGATGFPGYNSHLPDGCTPMAKILRDAGWSTFWVGKDHNVPIDQFHMGATKENWPLGMGYDRFYGFLGGETDQWFPDLVEDNHTIAPPYSPEEGYHLSKDLVDKAVGFIRDSKQAAPAKPWYLWLCPGANHAPHHAPQEYIEKYRGVFDDGYEAYRGWVLERMVQKGVLPEGTKLTPINPMPVDRFLPSDVVRPWDELTDGEKRLFSKMAEVYAAFSEYTDVQIGRLIDYLDESGQLENTLVLYCADNGASGEGSPEGSVNENKFFNSWPDSVEENLPLIDALGSPETYNHYPTGWAVAFSTPFKMFKRYSYSGGTCAPMVIHWPKGMTARGEVRHQYHHAVDVVPTILDACGVAMPAVYKGVEQIPLPGVSMRYSFDDAGAATTRRTQYYEMTGTRGLWRDGWKVVATHGSQPGIGTFDQDPWELYHVDSDRAEADDVSSAHPEKVTELVDAWFDEARKNNVLPLNDLLVHELVTGGLLFHEPVAPSGQYTYYPGTSAVPEQTAANTHGVSWKAAADVEFDADTRGVIFAQGSRFAGHALFVKDGMVYYVYNFLGIPPEQRLVGAAPPSGRHIVGVEFEKTGIGDHHEVLGNATLRVDDDIVDAQSIRTVNRFSLTGEGLCIGYDNGDAVSGLYTPTNPFLGGTLHKVVFDIADDLYLDLEGHIKAAWARD